MPVETRYGPTPWSVQELQTIYGLASSTGKVRQRHEAVEEAIVETLAPAVAALRGDRAASWVVARIRWISALLDRIDSDPAVMTHLRRLLAIAADRAAADAMTAATHRFSAPAPSAPASPSGLRRAAPDPAMGGHDDLSARPAHRHAAG